MLTHHRLNNATCVIRLNGRGVACNPEWTRRG